MFTRQGSLVLIMLAWAGISWGMETQSLILQAPPVTFLDEEAGISAYVNVGQTINIDAAKGAFVSLEKETADYIIGSIRPSGYEENENMEIHGFVHKDGWIITYYGKDEPRSMIFDRRKYKTNQSKAENVLQNGINLVCDKAGVLQYPTNVNYYDFKYPNANRLMVIVDSQWDVGWDTMYLTIPNKPGIITVYQTSWSHASYDTWHVYGSDSEFKVDGTQYSVLGSIADAWLSAHGVFQPSLSLGTRHKIELSFSDSYYASQLGEAYLAIGVLYYEKPE